jgi:signal transduction protein with GAF and PtsI domain
MVNAGGNAPSPLRIPPLERSSGVLRTPIYTTAPHAPAARCAAVAGRAYNAPMSTAGVDLATQKVLNRLLETVLEDFTLVDLLSRSLEIITSVPWISLKPQGGIFLREPGTRTLRLTAQLTMSQSVRDACARVEFGECLCGLAAQEKAIQFADCVDDRHTVTYPGMPPHGNYSVPIMDTDKNTLGVLVVYVDEGHQCSELELEFFTAVSRTLSGLIRRTQLEAEAAKTGQVAVLNSMIVTLNHEINNPLAVAKLALSLYREKGEENFLDEVGGCLTRIGEIVKKISDLRDSAPDFDQYSRSRTMLKIDKSN